MPERAGEPTAACGGACDGCDWRWRSKIVRIGYQIEGSGNDPFGGHGSLRTRRFVKTRRSQQTTITIDSQFRTGCSSLPLDPDDCFSTSGSLSRACSARGSRLSRCYLRLVFRVVALWNAGSAPPSKYIRSHAELLFHQDFMIVAEPGRNLNAKTRVRPPEIK